MVENYDLFVGGCQMQRPFGDPEELLNDVLSNGDDTGSIRVVVWISLASDPIAISLDWEQFCRCLEEGKLPKVDL